MGFSPQGCCETDFILAFSSIPLCYISAPDNPWFNSEENKESVVSCAKRCSLNPQYDPELGRHLCLLQLKEVRQPPALCAVPWPGVCAPAKSTSAAAGRGFPSCVNATVLDIAQTHSLYLREC